jgi:tRNA threonylcarbamoyladenosine biosynthesis protein TsaE
MGAGKSSLVRAMLGILAPSAQSQGSPTFPLMTQYLSQAGFPIYHLDLYRLRSEQELHDSGIESQIEEPGAVVMIEWASLFEDYFDFYLSTPDRIGKTSVFIRIESSLEGKRNYEILY